MRARASEAGSYYVTYQLNVNNAGTRFMTIARLELFPRTELVHSMATYMYVTVTESSKFYLYIFCPTLLQVLNAFFDDGSLNCL